MIPREEHKDKFAHVRHLLIEDSDVKKRVSAIQKEIDAYEMEDRMAAWACYWANISPEQAKELGIH
jgi:hypothetical protein